MSSGTRTASNTSSGGARSFSSASFGGRGGHR
jgi:hypothetical protein